MCKKATLLVLRRLYSDKSAAQFSQYRGSILIGRCETYPGRNREEIRVLISEDAVDYGYLQDPIPRQSLMSQLPLEQLPLRTSMYTTTHPCRRAWPRFETVQWLRKSAFFAPLLLTVLRKFARGQIP